MKKTDLKALIKEAFLAEQKNTLLNESAPGFENRQQGEALPTLESIKAAYQAKKLEEAEIEDKKLTYSDFVEMVKADMRAGAANDENASKNQIERVARWKYDDYLKGTSVDDLFEATKEAEIEEAVGELKEALNKDLKSFGVDLKKFMEGKGLKVELKKGSSQPLYDPIGKNPNFAALNLQDDDLHVIVNDSKIDVLEDIIKRYNLKPLQSLKQTGGWADDPKKRAQSEGEIYISSDKPRRRGEAFTLELRRFDPSTIMETNETLEDTKEETEATRELTAAVKDLGDAKEEAGLKEDRFVDAALEDLRTVIDNLAHTSGMDKGEAAEMAVMHIEDMFMGGGEEEDMMEEGTPTVFDDKSMDDLLNIILKYVEDPADAEKELERFDAGGFEAMSDSVQANLDRDEEYKAWYNELHSIKEEDKKDYWADYTDIGMFYLEGSGRGKSLTDDEYEELGEKIVKQLYAGDVGKAYDNIVRGRKRGSTTDIKEEEALNEYSDSYVADMMKGKTEEEAETAYDFAVDSDNPRLARAIRKYLDKMNETIIANADMIVESFKK